MTDRRIGLRHWHLLLGLVLAATAGGSGCSVFQSWTAPSGPSENAEAQNSPAVTPPAARVKPGKHSFRVSQFIFYSDVPLEPSDPLFQELEQLPDQLQAELHLPPSHHPVQVFLFEDKERYEAYIKSRDSKLPMRPAFFFAEQRGNGLPDDLYVFTWLGKRLRTDLRHELTHALLHGVLKNVPLWLDEGLAGYFEQPPSFDGVNLLHLEAVRAGQFRPNLARLEKLDKVEQMQRPEYQEAWAWVHFMLRGHPKARSVLLEYLKELRTNASPPALHTRLEQHVPEIGTALTEYLRHLEPPAARPARGR